MALPSLKMPNIVANFFKGREFTYEAPKVGETSPIYPTSLLDTLLLKNQGQRYDYQPENIMTSVQKTAAKFNFNTNDLYKYLKKESTFNPTAVSDKGAVGIAQFTPIGTQEVKNKYNKNFDPLNNDQAIDAMGWFFDYISKQIKTRNVDEIWKAYNMGISGYKKANPKKIIPEVQAAGLPSMKIPAKTADSMNFEVGAGFTPEMRAWYESRGMPSPQENVTKQTIPVGTEIKLPFMQKGMTVPSDVLGGLTKGLVEYPERLAGSAKEFLTDTIYGRVAPTPQNKSYNVPTIQQQMSDVFAGYANADLPWWTVPLEITGAFLDLTIAGSFIKAGVRAVASRATEAEVKNAWDFLGRPKTAEDMNNTVRELQKIYHPDMPTGNAAKSTAINNAYNILKEKGLPTGGILERLAGQAAKLEKPVSDLFKTEYGQPGYAGTRGLLTEQAGAQPTQPFQPVRQPAFGLSLREVPEKPIVPKTTKPVEAFLQSANQKTITIIGKQTFEMGTYGENALTRKIGQTDRFSPTEIKQTLDNIVSVYKAGEDTFRKDNLVWVSKMSDGELRAVVTRLNSAGKEEIINAFKIGRNPEGFISNLIKFGTPERSRTAIAGLEDQGSIQLAYGGISKIPSFKKPVKFMEGITKTPQQTVLSDIFKKELANIKQEGRLDISEAIKRLGGIRISGGIKEEIMESIPTHLLNKNGQSLDEMAQELHSQGFTNIVDGDSLRAELEKVYANKVEPIVGKDPVTKTPEFQAIPDDMKARITTFFRPSRKLESRAFSLLGNKDTTIPLLRNTFNEWVKSGVDTIIEPYAGAFTVGTHGLNDAIKSGLKNFYSNVFDKEKYLIVKAVQDGRMPEVKGAIDDAVKRFSDKVYEYSAGDTKVRKVLDDFFKENPGANIGSREFYSFIRKQPIGSQITVYEDDFKSWSSVFNRAYKDLFVKEPESLRDAAMTSFLKRIEQRQGEIVTHNGFTSYFNKIYGDVGMVAGLEDMMKSFQLAKEYGTNIHLYNKDGAEFIKSINAKSLGTAPDKVGYYFDPPYVKSASVYDNAQELDNFSSGYQLATSHENAFHEAKQGAKMLLTNDVEAEYIAEMEKRLENPGLFAYREGTTPTSLITDANTKPIITQYLSTAEKIAGEREEVALVKAMQIEKNLSTATFARIRKNLGIENLKKATDEKLAQFLVYLEKLQPGDKLLTDLQIEATKDLIKEGDFIDPVNLITQRDFIAKFKEQVEIASGFPERFIMNELFPTVTLKQGHPLVTKIVDKSDDLMKLAEKNQEGRDERFDKMITIAEKSKKDLPLLEKLRRGVTPQNKEIFQALSGYPVKLTQEEVAVVAYLKNFFKKVRDDLKLEKHRKYYVTHLEKPLMEKLTTKGLKDTVVEMLKRKETISIPTNIMLELDNIIGSEKFFKFALERKGGLDPTTNLRKIVHDYGQLYETKMALDQILPEAQMITRLLLKPQTALWQQSYLKNLKGRGLDYNFRNGKMGWLANIANKINDISYVQYLGLNWRSPLKNELAGIVNNFIVQSLDKFITGQVRFAHSPRKAIKIMKEYGLLEGMFYDYALSVVGKITRVMRWTLIGQKMGEYHIRTSLAAGEMTTAEWKSGVLSPARVREIYDIISEAQGTFSKTQSPLALQHWLGRSMFLMNRWRLTNFNLFMKSARTAKEEIKGGNFKGRGSSMFVKSLLAYGIGMFFYYKLYEAGYKGTAAVAKSMAEVINGMVALFTTDEIMQMVVNNPATQDAVALFKSIQQLAHYLHVPGVQEPQDWIFKKGLQDLYIAPVTTIKQLLGIPTTKTKKGGGKPPAGMPSMQLPSMQLPSMKMPSMKF